MSASGIPLVRKFPYRKEILPLGRKKEGNENCKEKEGNFGMSKEITIKSRNSSISLTFHLLIGSVLYR